LVAVGRALAILIRIVLLRLRARDGPDAPSPAGATSVAFTFREAAAAACIGADFVEAAPSFMTDPPDTRAAELAYFVVSRQTRQRRVAHSIGAKRVIGAKI
jgi:hypothetical protein